MKRVLAILVVASVAVAAAWLIVDIPGDARVRVGDLVIETSASVALAGAVGVIIVAHIALRCVAWVARLPSTVRRWRAVRRRALGDDAVTRALVALAAGTGGPAVKAAIRARALLGDTAQTLLLVAEAEHLAGHEDRAARAYETLADTPDTALIGLRGLLRQAVARGDWVGAGQLARRAETTHPAARWARDERLRLAIRAGDWEGALTFATTDAARFALGTAAANAAADPDQARRLARDAHRGDPGLAAAAVAYARALRRLGDETALRSAARNAWKTAPSAELADIVLAAAADRLARVSVARGLVELNPDHAESHILLARVALDAGLPGMARDHLETLRGRDLDDRRVWTMLAEAATDPADRAEVARRADMAKSSIGWHCDACGAASVFWEPACRICLTAGSLRPASPGGSPRLAAA